MGDLPLRTPNDRRLGGPLPRQLANHTHEDPEPPELYQSVDADQMDHPVLIPVSGGYPSVLDTFHTRYAPVRRSLVLLLYPSACMY